MKNWSKIGISKVLFPNRKSAEVELNEWNIAGASPKVFCKELRFGVNFPCALQPKIITQSQLGKNEY